jgi:hypothetical protein
MVIVMGTRINKQKTMNHHLKIPKSFLKVRFVAILFMIVFANYMSVFAQEKKVDTNKVITSKLVETKIDLDTPNFDEETKGLFKKIAKLLKFKDARNKSEEERVYKYIHTLIRETPIKLIN